MTRTLTPEQIAAITAAIGETGTLEILVDTAQDDAQAYADQFSQTITDAGWTVISGPLPNPWFATPSGLSFMAQGDLPHSERQGDVLAALNSADLEYSQLDNMLPEAVDVRLMVGRVGV